jgi:hypothetical protein
MATDVTSFVCPEMDRREAGRKEVQSADCRKPMCDCRFVKLAIANLQSMSFRRALLANQTTLFVSPIVPFAQFSL